MQTRSQLIRCRGRRRIAHRAGLPVAAHLQRHPPAHRRHDLFQEVFQAARVQQQLFAPALSRRGPFEIATEIAPLAPLSGDFCFLVETAEDTVLALGDVEGKGFSAALWVPHLYALIRKFVRKHVAATADLAAAMAAINHNLHSLQPNGPLVSLFLARLQDNGDLVYSNAGHPAALLLSGDDGHWLEVGGPVLGALREPHYQQGHVQLASGDTLMVFSDGLSESADLHGREFGSKRLLAAARHAGPLSPSALAAHTLAAVAGFSSGRPANDDLSLAVVRYCLAPQA